MDFNKITLDKSKLLSALESNKQKHDTIVAEANESYKSEAFKLLTERLESLKQGQPVNLVFALHAPLDYSSEYNRAIEILKMTTDDTVYLTTQEFDSYVLNNWNWKNSFMLTNSRYVSGCAM